MCLFQPFLHTSSNEAKLVAMQTTLPTPSCEQHGHLSNPVNILFGIAEAFGVAWQASRNMRNMYFVAGACHTQADCLSLS